MKQIIFTYNPENFKSEIVDEVTKNIVNHLNELKHPNEVSLVTKKEAAKLLKISISTLNRRTKMGELTAYYQCNRVFYKKNELLKSLIPSNQSK